MLFLGIFIPSSGIEEKSMQKNNFLNGAICINDTNLCKYGHREELVIFVKTSNFPPACGVGAGGLVAAALERQSRIAGHSKPPTILETTKKLDANLKIEIQRTQYH